MYTPWYELPLERCPICGKGFAPAPEHGWKINNGETLVCSYTCMRAWEREQEKKARKRARNTIEKR